MMFASGYTAMHLPQSMCGTVCAFAMLPDPRTYPKYPTSRKIAIFVVNTPLQ